MKAVDPVNIQWHDITLRIPVGKVSESQALHFIHLCHNHSRSFRLLVSLNNYHGSSSMALYNTHIYNDLYEQKKFKTVLHGISGELKAGSITAIMVSRTINSGEPAPVGNDLSSSLMEIDSG